MCEAFAESKRLLVLALESGGQTLGIQIWLRGGDGLFGVKVAYDERYARSGPGALLHVESLDFIHQETDATWADPCASAENVFHMGLYPERTRISTNLFALRGPVDHLLVRALPGARALRRRARSLLAPVPTPGAVDPAATDDAEDG
jgi:hypothetical protein